MSRSYRQPKVIICGATSAREKRDWKRCISRIARRRGIDVDGGYFRKLTSKEYERGVVDYMDFSPDTEDRRK